MKSVFAIFAIILVVVNAGPIGETPVNYEIQVDDILDEIAQIAKDAADALQKAFDDIVLDRLRQVEEVLESIEALRLENEECVAAEDENIAAIVDIMHKNMSDCGVLAADASADIMIDISIATQQLVFDGYDVIRTCRKCQGYTNPILSSSCYFRLTIKATLYMNKASKSIKTIRESTNERIPAVVADADECIQIVTDAIIRDLTVLMDDMAVCISVNEF